MKKPDTIEAYFEGTDVHDESRVGPGSAIAVVAALVFFVLHGYNSWLFFHEEAISFGKALTFHILLSSASGLLVLAFAGSARENRFLLLLFIATTTTGIFGAAGTLLCILLHNWYMSYAQPFGEWFTSIFPSSARTTNEQIYEDIQVGRDESSKPYSVISFTDVIRYGSESQKRMALSKMTSRFHHSFAPAFRLALNDTSNNIRVQAATAISKIENQFTARLMKLNELLDEHPQNLVIIMAIAEYYDNYAFTGILDDDRERHNREQAHRHYKEYLALKPGSAEAYLKIGRLLMRSGKSKEALDWLRQSIDRGHSSPALTTWYAEALYASGRFSELRELARNSNWKEFENALHPSVVESLSFWLSKPADIKSFKTKEARA